MATIMYHDHPYAGGLTEPVSADEVVYGDSNVEAALDSLNTVESNTYTIPTYGGTVTCKRCGHVVTTNIVGLGSSSTVPQGTSAHISLGIADKYKPNQTIFAAGTQNGNLSGTALCMYELFPDGVLYFYAYEAVSSGNVSFAYIV